MGATEIESNDLSPMTVRSALELLSAAFALHPAFGEAHIIEMNAQCRPTFKDHRPRIVWDGQRTIEVNGLYRHGFLLAPVMVQGVCDLVQKIDTDLRAQQNFSEWQALSPWSSIFSMQKAYENSH